MNPPLRTEDDRAARSSKGSSTGRSTASPPTTRRTRATRRTRRSRRRRSASPGSRRRSRRSTRTSCERARSRSAIVLERLSAGPARALGLPVPRIAVGEPANLVLLDLEAEWTVSEDALPLALGQLVAPRADARRRGRQDRRRRQGGVRRVTAPARGYLLLEDGTVFRGRSVAAAGVAFGEAVFTTGMTGYQETVTDPSYARAARLLHGADGRQLRRRRRAARVRGAARPRGAHAPARRRGAGRSGSPSSGIVALDEIDTRALTLRLRDARRDARRRGRRRARARRRGRARAGAGAAADGGRCARRAGLDAGAVRRRARRGGCAWRSSTTASSGRSCAGSPSQGRP